MGPDGVRLTGYGLGDLRKTCTVQVQGGDVVVISIVRQVGAAIADEGGSYPPISLAKNCRLLSTNYTIF